MFPPNPESFSARRGYLSLSLFVLVSLMVCVLAVLTPTLAGAIAGYQQLQNENHENAILHYQRGLGYLAESYPDLAQAEFQISLRYDDSFDPALEKLQGIQTRVAEQSNPASANPGNTITGKLLDEARKDISQKLWNEAIDRLEQLQGVDANFQTQTVNDLLFQSYSESGKQASLNGEIELARERFDAALTLRKDPEITRQRDMAELYLDGQQAVGNDWPTAIQRFTTLYQLDPNYDDVKKRLTDAHVQYGDRAAKGNAWCLAAREYDRAGALIPDILATQKYSQATTRCKQTANVTPTITAVAGITTTTPVPTLTAVADAYTLLRNRPTAQACTGNGDISGTLTDALGNPIPGFYIAYEGENINRITATTDVNGKFLLGLGRDAATLRVFVLAPDGKTPSGIIVNVIYPGGTNAGCHIVVDWQKIQ